MKICLRKIGSIVLATMLIISVSACDVKNGSSSSTSTASTSATDATPTPAPVTIKFTSYFVEGDTAEAPAIAYHQAMDEFLTANPNITLEEEILNHDSYEEKMMALSASNELPDMFQLKGLWIVNFAASGLLGEMDAMLEADSEWTSNFIEGSFDEFILDDVTYGIPYQIATTGNLFYNKGIFDECGITTFPKNLTEFKAAIVTLKKAGYIPMTIGNLGGWFLDVVTFRSILDRYAGPEWSISLVEGTGAKFTDPEFVGALNELLAISELGAFNSDINSIDYIQMRTAFYNREAAMMMDGSGGILPFCQEAPAEILEETEITVLPELTGGKSYGNPATTGWSIGYSSAITDDKKPVVEAMLKALSTPQFAGIIAENNGFPAVNPSDYDETKLYSLTVKYNEMLAKTPITTMASLQPTVLGVMYPGLQELLLKTKTAEKLAAELQAEQDALE